MPNRIRNKIRRWIYNHLPKWMKTRDFEVFAAILCIVAGLPMLFGKVESRSLESQLPTILVYLWASALVAGGVCILVGIIKSARDWAHPSDFILWRRVEAYGLTMLAYMAYILVLAAMLTDWQHVFSSVMLILVFAFTCHSREIAVQLEIVDYRMALGLGHVRQ